MSYADFCIKMYFHVKRQEEALRTSWEQTRYVAFCVVATQTDKIKSPQDLLPFSWDVKKRVKKVSEKSLSEIAASHLEYLQKMSKNE